MHESETLIPTDDGAVAALVDLVAATHASGALTVSTARLVDALLDARSGAPDPVVAVIDGALSGLGFRSVVTTEEALETVAAVSAAAHPAVPA